MKTKKKFNKSKKYTYPLTLENTLLFCVSMGTCAMLDMGNPKDSFVELVFSFYFYVVSGDCTPVVRLA